MRGSKAAGGGRSQKGALNALLKRAFPFQRPASSDFDALGVKKPKLEDTLCVVETNSKDEDARRKLANL